jgi:hypothetical protein
MVFLLGVAGYVGQPCGWRVLLLLNGFFLRATFSARKKPLVTAAEDLFVDVVPTRARFAANARGTVLDE